MEANIQKYLDIVRPHLTEHRYIHTLGVLQTAKELQGQYGGDVEALQIAAALHDIAKFWETDRMKQEIKRYGIDPAILSYDKETWHAPVGAEFVKHELGMDNEKVIDCIRNHTVGRPHMGLEEKIIWLSDYIEPGRHFPGVDEVREAAKESLDSALVMAFDRTIMFLIKQRKKIHPNTLETRNWLIDI